jgi:predicted PurR-regulated permease PerM
MTNNLDEEPAETVELNKMVEVKPPVRLADEELDDGDDGDPEAVFVSLSPPWTRSAKRQVAVILLIFFLLVLYQIRNLLVPIILAFVVAYVVEPIVGFLYERLKLKRPAAIVLIYLTILAVFIAIPIFTIPQVIAQVTGLVENGPNYVEQLGQFLERLEQPIQIGSFTIPTDELPLDQAYQAISENLLNILQTVGTQSLSIFGSVASATFSTLGWTLVILVVSFYIVMDRRQLTGSVVDLFPVEYQNDLRMLGREISLTWNAFLRGQLILFAIMGVSIFLLATIIGLPNALLLGLISGLAEFIPNLGAILAAIPAVLIAFFQADASWLGRTMSPFWFAVVVLGLYILAQQIENLVLVPRVIGRSLNLHPVVVFVGAIAGASVAGILGVLLAAPLLASARLVLLYVFRKLYDLPPFPEAELEAQAITSSELVAAADVIADRAAG